MCQTRSLSTSDRKNRVRKTVKIPLTYGISRLTKLHCVQSVQLRVLVHTEKVQHLRMRTLQSNPDFSLVESDSNPNWRALIGWIRFKSKLRMGAQSNPVFSLAESDLNPNWEFSLVESDSNPNWECVCTVKPCFLIDWIWLISKLRVLIGWIRFKSKLRMGVYSQTLSSHWLNQSHIQIESSHWLNQIQIQIENGCVQLNAVFSLAETDSNPNWESSFVRIRFKPNWECVCW